MRGLVHQRNQRRDRRPRRQIGNRRRHDLNGVANVTNRYRRHEILAVNWRVQWCVSWMI